MADQMLVCRECQNQFVFTEGEQSFFAQKGLSLPTRCPSCRKERRRQRDSGMGGGGRQGSWRPAPELYDVVCAECGVQTQVPFKPRGTHPVYCRACFQAKRH